MKTYNKHQVEGISNHIFLAVIDIIVAPASLFMLLYYTAHLLQNPLVVVAWVLFSILTLTLFIGGCWLVWVGRKVVYSLVIEGDKITADFYFGRRKTLNFSTLKFFKERESEAPSFYRNWLFPNKKYYEAGFNEGSIIFPDTFEMIDELIVHFHKSLESGAIDS